MKTYFRVYRDDDFADKGYAYKVTDETHENVLECGHTYDYDMDGSVRYVKSIADRISNARMAGEKYHCFRVMWQTNTRFVSRSYSRDFETEEEAVAKARQIHDKKDHISVAIRVDEVESWDTPDPAPNGTHHCKMLRMNIDWWTGFLPWWETER